MDSVTALWKVDPFNSLSLALILLRIEKACTSLLIFIVICL